MPAPLIQRFSWTGPNLNVPMKDQGDYWAAVLSHNPVPDRVRYVGEVIAKENKDLSDAVKKAVGHSYHRSGQALVTVTETNGYRQNVWVDKFENSHHRTKYVIDAATYSKDFFVSRVTNVDLRSVP